MAAASPCVAFSCATLRDQNQTQNQNHVQPCVRASVSKAARRRQRCRRIAVRQFLRGSPGLAASDAVEPDRNFACMTRSSREDELTVPRRREESLGTPLVADCLPPAIPTAELGHVIVNSDQCASQLPAAGQKRVYTEDQVLNIVQKTAERTAVQTELVLDAVYKTQLDRAIDRLSQEYMNIIVKLRSQIAVLTDARTDLYTAAASSNPHVPPDADSDADDSIGDIDYEGSSASSDKDGNSSRSSSSNNGGRNRIHRKKNSSGGRACRVHCHDAKR